VRFSPLFGAETSNVELQQTLEELYVTVDDIDLWAGALAEDHLPGSSVGETVQTIVVDQFTRIRDGDRLWYENAFSNRDVRQLKGTTLSDVIRRNTNVSNLQENVFFTSATVSGRVLGEGGAEGRRDRRDQGVAGVIVELLDDEGEVVDTVVTDRRGFYLFDNFLETGDYQVRVLRPTAGGLVEETNDVLISRGGLAIDNLDFISRENQKNDQRNDRRGKNDRLAAVDAVLGAGVGQNDVAGLAEELATRPNQRNRR